MKSIKGIIVRFLQFFAVVSLLVAAFGVAPAAAAPELRVGYVDLQKALADSKAGKKAQKQYEAEVKKAQAGLDKKKTEFDSLRKKFEKQRGSLNDQALADKEEELITLERDIKRSFQDAQQKLRRKNAVLVGDLIKEIRKVVDDIGRDKGFTVILEKGSQAVLYADHSIDITELVVEKFDKVSGK